MDQKPKYSRSEKIAYYAKTIAYLEMAIERNRSLLRFAKNRLKTLQDDNYQDWDSDLAKELAAKKGPE